MAKRHKHYSEKKKNKTKNKNRHGKFSHKGKNHSHEQYANRFSLNDNNKNTHNIDEDDDFIWNNSSLPIGNSNLMANIHEDMRDINYGKNHVSPKSIEDYYFGRNNIKNNHSLKYAALRLLNRNEDTSLDNYDNSITGYRQRKMVFIKAKEPYDPSHELIERLRSKKNEQLLKKDMSMVRSIDIADDSKEEDNYDDYADNIPINILDTSLERDITASKEKYNDEKDESVLNDPSDFSSATSSSEIISDKDLFFVDETGCPVDTETSVKTVISENDYVEANDINNNNQVTKQRTNLEFNPSLVIGKVELSVTESNSCGEYDNDNNIVYSNVRVEPKSKFTSSIERNYNKMSPLVLQKKINKGQNYNVRKELTKDLFTPEEYDDNHTFNNDNMSIMIKEESSNISDKIILKNIESLKLGEHQSDIDSKSNNEEDPEFGLLEEDYIINTSEVRVSNIRLGLHENSYYVESYKLFGDYESRWLDQELFTDFILNDLNLPEHRLKSYLRYIKDSLIPKEETPEPEYLNILTDNEEEEEEESDSNSESNNETDEHSIPDDMMEGLDDLVSYTLKYNDTRNQEFETHALQTIGKGKKKRFLVNEDMQLDGETILTLQDKLQRRTLQKAKKKRTKEDFISEENKNSKDLFKKYPFGLHVQNIKDEFELFLSYSSDSLSFPPLDPHGNKTVTKFANHYNMKTKKSGRGNKQHIIIQKTKKTRWGTPNYNLISQLLKQRPIFMRTDVSRISETQVSGRVIRERFNITKAKFHVKEGEIVGEDAPEIGKDNIGRRLLEKLGWSSGEGLGAHGNKGISEPVLAVVKKNKTGLGHRIKEFGDSNSEGDRSHKRYPNHKRRRRHANRFH